MRTGFICLCLLLLAGSAGADDAEAKKLYQGYEEKVTQARTLKIVYTQQTTVNKKTQTVQGTILLGEGNRLRWEETGAEDFLLVGDNKEWILAGLRGGMLKAEKLPEHARRSFLFMLVPSSISLDISLMQIGSPKELLLPIGVSSLQSKGSEKVGMREATVLTYKFGHSVLGETPVKLWLDTQTGLPLKRQIGDDLTETFTEFTLNPKIEGDPFKVQEVLERTKAAKKLLTDMEAKILQAKVVKIELEATATQRKTPASFKGTVILGQGGKAWIELVHTEGKVVKTEKLIADGKRGIGSGRFFDTEGQVVAVEDDFTRTLLPLIARGGVILTLDSPGRGDKDKFDLNAVLPLYAVALGRKEKLGDREAQVVQFVSELRDRIVVTVWIDTKTGLPLQRTLCTERTEGTTLTETYRSFQLDPPLAANQFDLPKK